MRKLIIGLSVLVGLSQPLSGSAALVETKVEAKSAMVIDQATGQILYAKDAEKRRPIASLSKLLTVTLVEKKLAEGTLKLEHPVPISKKVQTFSQDHSVANVDLRPQERYRVKDLLNAAMLPSSNSAAIVLAELVAGNQATYYRQAEGLLNQLGITNASIYSASGLMNGDMGPFTDKKVGKRVENQLSATEVAQVAQHLVTKYPKVLDVTSLRHTAFPGGQTLTNTNQMVGEPHYQIDGLKTGSTPYNGKNLVTTGKIHGRAVITVVLNTAPKATPDTIFNDTKRLYQAVEHQTKVVPVAKPEPVLMEAAGAKSKAGQIEVMPVEVGLFVGKASRTAPTVQATPLTLTQPVPVPKHTVVGSRELDLSQTQDVSFLKGEAPKVDYQTTEYVEAAGLITTGWHHLQGLWRKVFN